MPYGGRQTMTAGPDARGAILSLLAARGPGKTICPSEAARLIGGEDWRGAMPAVHDAAHELVADGAIELRQGGETRAADKIVGAYRIARLI